MALLLNSCGNERPGASAINHSNTIPQSSPTVTPLHPRVNLSRMKTELKTLNIPMPGDVSFKNSKQDAEPLQQIVRTLKNVYDQFEKPVQLIRIDGSEDTIIILKEGTILKIPGKIFVLKNQSTPVTGPVEIKVREYYRAIDIVSGRLTTQCGQSLLESGGMINIEVWNNDKMCAVAQGKSFEIGFPDKSTRNQMEIFEGIENSQGKIVWQRPEKMEQEVFTVVAEQTTYPGGDGARIEFLHGNLKYPEEAKELGIQGKVYVTFIVEVDGSLSDVRVLRGIGGGCDEAAVKAVKKMPEWMPGKQRGVPVRVQFNLPINFVLDLQTNIGKAIANDQGEAGNQGKTYQRTSIRDLNAFFLSSYRTGWINCDRYVNSRQGVMDYVIDEPGADSVDMIMLFHKLKTIISPSITRDNKLVFRNVPSNEAVTMLGIKVKNNKIYIAVQADVTKLQHSRKLSFNEVDDNGLKKAFEVLDGFNL